MRKKFDVLSALLVTAGVAAVLIAWWALLHVWRYL